MRQLHPSAERVGRRLPYGRRQSCSDRGQRQASSLAAKLLTHRSVGGGVMPLHADEAEMEVEMPVQARSDSGRIQQTTLDQKAREILRQIGAEVEEDTAE